MTFDIEKERAKFEAWFTENDDDPRMAKRAVERDAQGNYLLMAAGSAWRVWQARTEISHNEMRDAIKGAAVINDVAMKEIATLRKRKPGEA